MIIKSYGASAEGLSNVYLEKTCNNHNCGTRGTGEVSQTKPSRSVTSVYSIFFIVANEPLAEGDIAIWNSRTAEARHT